MKGFIGVVFLALAGMMGGCGDVSSSAQSGFPSLEASVSGGDCEEGVILFENTPSPGGAYIFGDIESVEPILDGVRAHGNVGGDETYIDKEQYSCENFGIAALRLRLSNVRSAWDELAGDVVVDITATSLRGLTTSPRIEAGTQKLQWAVSKGQKAKFPGVGDRIGLPIYGTAHGDHLASAFHEVMEVHEDGTITRHLGSDCVAFDEQKFPTEEAVIAELKNNPDYATLDLGNDYTWRTTSICVQD